MRKTLLSVSLSLLVSTAYSADNGMRPGLWEMKTTSDLLALVPQIPSDQMQKLADLARQYGVDMPNIQNGAATSKVCITREMADQNVPPAFHHAQSGCDVQNAARIGNSYKMDLVCAGDLIKGSGKAEGTFTSPESFTGTSEFNGVVQGNAVNERAETSGRWISARCGTVQPAR
jgi:hypothetical protein